MIQDPDYGKRLAQNLVQLLMPYEEELIALERDTPSFGPLRRALGIVIAEACFCKAGNSAARRTLVEVAWHYQHSARVTPIIATRHDHLPKAVTDIAWAAQLRLNAKFKRLVARRVLKTKAVVAVARELTGFVWAIGREVQGSGWAGIDTDAAAAVTH